jgi:hypothetical protein
LISEGGNEMRTIMLGLAVAAALTAGAGVSQAAGLSDSRATVQSVYWDGDYCGPRCQEHRAWRRHERWEARRAWRHHRWEERRYGYYAYPQYGYNAYPRY